MSGYRFIMWGLLGVQLSSSGQIATDQSTRRTDPAPPQVQVLEVNPAHVEAKPHPNVKYFGPPRELAAGAVQADWPNFLGLTRDMHSPETHLLSGFDGGTLRPVWQLTRGTGYVSPSIRGDHLVYQHRVADQVIVECLKADTGAAFWAFSYPSSYEDRYRYSNGPRATPAIAGDRVVISGVEGQLFCLDLASGRVIWQRQLRDEFKAATGFFGYGSTPLVADGRVIVNLSAADGLCVAAFSLADGKLLWGADSEWGASYASPMPVHFNGRDLVAVFAGGESKPPVGGLLLLEPDSGRILGRFPWRSKKYESVNASTPVQIGDAIFLSASYQLGSVLLEVQPVADAAAPWGLTPRWRAPAVELHWTTPLIFGQFAYGFSGRNSADLICFSLADGQEKWRESLSWHESYSYYGEQRERDFDLNRGSLLAADGRVYALGEYGHLAILKPGPEGAGLLDKAWLFAAGETWTPPVLSHGLLYICQNSPCFTDGAERRLICYDLRAATPQFDLPEKK